MSTPIEIVQRAYAAFAQGDIPGVLELLTEDVVWRFHADGDIPYGGTYIGKPKVQEWFSKLAGSTEIQQFEPREFLAGPTHVTVIGWERSKPLPDGKVYASSGAGDVRDCSYAARPAPIGSHVLVRVFDGRFA